MRIILINKEEESVDVNNMEEDEIENAREIINLKDK